jgi:hypothetical protein
LIKNANIVILIVAEDSSLQVCFEDAPAGTAAVDGGQFHAEFAGEAAYRRRCPR